MDFLKPNKANLIGTALLLVADVIGGSVSRIASSLARGAAGTAMNGTAASAGRGAFAGGTRSAAGSFGLVSGALNIVILAVLFYVVISFVVAKLGKEPDVKPAKAG
ncbi:Uncharacterised protein [uncultured archaeon]|nr:Uncharacterised protein [uncultured archaeon]